MKEPASPHSGRQPLIDLHVHSCYSDGTCSPAELVSLAEQISLRAFALTDHDTTDGICEALAAARDTHMEVIPGIEFSTRYESRDIHILGLGIDHQNEAFQTKLHHFRHSRDIRNEKIIKKLQETGIPITLEEMEHNYPDAVWTRAHFAAWLKDHGYVSTVNEAFTRFIGDRAPCFVPREKVTPETAIRLIHQAGGYAVLAHPLLYGMSKDQLHLLVSQVKQAGCDAIEAIYSSNRGGDEAAVRQLAKQYQLKITGGSDFHGDNKPQIHLGIGRGNLHIPYYLWENLKD